ncbi:MAG: hypothetical protein FJ122_12030 [Deltaproteobacteria bacterium]|nr:hypothetical protein [Deltaproteobacteria bacterium]
MNRSKILIPILFVAFVLSACSTYKEEAREREERAQKATGDIRIALVWQEKLFKSYFYEGVDLAVDEINRAGGINGRKIRTVRYNNETASLERDMDLARKIVADSDIVAVIGHYLEVGSIVASVSYQYGGLLYIASAATSVRFSRHGFELIFRNTPHDRVNGVDLADFAKTRGFSNILILDDRTIYGKGLADVFHERASKIGINVVSRRSYNQVAKDYKPLFDQFKKLAFDAIFLGGRVPPAAEVVRQARVMGVTVPFIGGNGLDFPLLWDIAGKAAEGTITPTTFHHDDKQGAAQVFSKAFYARYQAHPDTWAAQGYDAVRVLAAMIVKAGTTAPVVVASHLRFLENWDGVLGTYSFTREGDVTGDINKFQVLRNGQYELIERELP